MQTGTGLRQTLDNVVLRVTTLTMAVGRLEAAHDRGEAIQVEAAIARCWDELRQLDRALDVHATAYRGAGVLPALVAVADDEGPKGDGE